jgi:hypothetical protein
MAGTLQKNPQYKNYMSDAKNNVADGAGVSPLDTRYIVAQNKPGALAQTLTSGLQGAAASVLSDATPGVVGNTILEARATADDFASMTVTQIVVAAAVGNNPPIATITTTPLLGQAWQVGMQVGLRGCTSVIGKTMNYDTYRSIEVLTVLSPIGTGFTAYAPTIAAGTGVESSTGDTTLLKTAGNYAILGGQSIVGSAGAGSVIQGGNIGISPNNATSVTNFPPSVLLAPGIFDYADAASLQAQTDLTAALVAYEALVYTNLGSAVNMSVSGNGSTAATYLPGNYKSTSSLDIPTTITLDAQGNAGAIFVFYATASTITLESGASVLLVNGAKAENVYWIAGSSFTSIWNGIVSNMVGNILAAASITLGGGDLKGRALAHTSVTLSTTETIEAPAFASAVASGATANLHYQGSLAGVSLAGGS